MFVGCSEISISVIVKHVQNIGIIRAFCLLLEEKSAGLRFARWGRIFYCFASCFCVNNTQVCLNGIGAEKNTFSLVFQKMRINPAQPNRSCAVTWIILHLKRGIISFLGVRSYLTYCLFHSLHGKGAHFPVVELDIVIWFSNMSDPSDGVWVPMNVHAFHRILQ